MCMDASMASPIASFSISRRGFAPIFFGAGAFFCFFALGGVADKSESSCIEGGSSSSSSLSGFGRFLETGLTFNLVCDAFLGAAAFVPFGALLEPGLGPRFAGAGFAATGLAFVGLGLNNTVS